MLYIDVGARGGMNELTTLHTELEAIGFEPEPNAYKALIQKQHTYTFKKKTIECLALSSQEGEFILHVANLESMSSILKFNADEFDKHFIKIKNAPVWKNGLTITHEQKIKATTLDKYAQEKQLPFIDYLKLDVQGYELEVLKGAKNILEEKQIGIIKTEVSFIPVYDGQVVFSELDQLLRSFGYEMILLTFDENWHNGTPRKANYEKENLYSGGDAYYMLKDTSLLPQQQIIDMAKILYTIGLFSIANHLLTHQTKISKEKINKMMESYGAKKTDVKQWIRYLLPPLIIDVLKKMKGK